MTITPDIIIGDWNDLDIYKITNYYCSKFEH